MSPSFALVAAYAIDRVLGEPSDRLHPVAWMGTTIAIGRDWALRAGRLGQLVRGVVVALAVPALFALLAHCALRASGRLPFAPVTVFLVTVILLKPMFAVRSLRDAAFAVRDALERDDLEAARRGLGSLCSRDASSLDAHELIAATIESVAENASDSVVAPIFFFACFGVPGAVFYRAVNTLDAMIGYHGRYEYVGKAAARLDDALNLVPARLTSLLLLAGGLGSGASVGRGVATLLRDGAKTESPNAGRPMAAMAGLLGLRLAKPGHYALGDAHDEPRPEHITVAWRITSLASLAAFGLTAVVVGVLHA
jgi:adenosylcobinamide-phosphate synthase